MPTLYVENVPEDLYEALRARAKDNRGSISAEVIALLAQHIPTAKELAARRAFYKQALKFQAQRPASAGPFLVHRGDAARGPRAVTGYVIDASVAAKWVLPSRDESFVHEAEGVLAKFRDRKLELTVPDLFWPEMTNILWKAVVKRRITGSDAVARVSSLRSLKLPAVSTGPLMEEAFAISLAFQRSAYDAFYVALAVASGRSLLTADERLANALGSRFPIRWLGTIVPS